MFENSQDRIKSLQRAYLDGHRILKNAAIIFFLADCRILLASRVISSKKVDSVSVTAL